MVKSPFMIYADFEIILVPESNRRRNLDMPYRNKYQNHANYSLVTNYYVLMISLASLLSHICV